jgi:hypothetical protein
LDSAQILRNCPDSDEFCEFVSFRVLLVKNRKFFSVAQKWQSRRV